MKQIKAKWASKCPETKIVILKGEDAFFDTGIRKAYHPTSQRAIQFLKDEHATGSIDQAEQEAYFDNFCTNNNI